MRMITYQQVYPGLLSALQLFLTVHLSETLGVDLRLPHPIPTTQSTPRTLASWRGLFLIAHAGLRVFLSAPSRSWRSIIWHIAPYSPCLRCAFPAVFRRTVSPWEAGLVLYWWWWKCRHLTLLTCNYLIVADVTDAVGRHLQKVTSVSLIKGVVASFNNKFLHPIEDCLNSSTR